ncbi:hypothetical protein HY484_01405 [Candidatus Woesearchaeota archaeon]|nr:hypothetical protein [Candidatus Woesearchaeota archaeon]
MRLTQRITTLILGTALTLIGCKDSRHKQPPPDCITTYSQSIRPYRSNENSQEYLGQTYANLLIEIDYDTLTAPEQTLLDKYRQKISERIQQKNISFRIDKINPFGCNTITIDDLAFAENITRDENTGAGTITIHVYWLTEKIGDNIVGVQYGPSSIALLRMPRNNTETLTALLHETGHVLGLVNKGIPALTNHTTDKFHCSTLNCIMEPKINYSDNYCQPCIDDIIAAGGR